MDIRHRSVFLFCSLLLAFAGLSAPARTLPAGATDWVMVDIGDALVGGTKDSLVVDYLINRGSAPLAIDSIRITGPDALRFRVLSPSAPLIIPAGDTFAVRLLFSPLRTGSHTATVETFSGLIPTSGALRGNGVLPAIVPTQDTVDFGVVPIGEFRDTVVSLVRNVTASDVVIPKVIQDGFDVPRFDVNGGGPTTLSGGQIHTATIRFSPTFIGTAQSRLIFEYRALGSPVQVILIGRGGSPLQAMATLEAPVVRTRVGDLVELPIRLRNTRNLDLLGITGFRVKLRMNASMLLPIAPTPRGVIDGKDRVITLDLPASGDRDSVLAKLRFRAIAGSDSTTALRLENAVATGGDAAMLTIPGSVAMTGFCQSGGARLIDVDAATRLKEIVPNPSDGGFTIGFDLSEDGPTTLTLTDLDGRQIATLLDRDMPAGSHSITIPAGTVPASMYYCVLRTRTEVESIRVVVRE